MRVKNETLRAQLLDHAMQIIDEQGPDALSIRALANQADIVPSTIYNYFTDKEDLYLAMAEKFWHDVATELRETVMCSSVINYVEEIYHFLKNRIGQSSGIMTAALRDVSDSARHRMDVLYNEMGSIMLVCIQRDTRIRPDAWNDHLTPEDFAFYTMVNIFALLRSEDTDIRFLLHIIERTIY